MFKFKLKSTPKFLSFKNFIENEKYSPEISFFVYLPRVLAVSKVIDIKILNALWFQNIRKSLRYKKTLAQVCSCEFCKTFKNTFLYRTPPVAASVHARNHELKISEQRPSDIPECRGKSFTIRKFENRLNK